jgi:hypothetical protein
LLDDDDEPRHNNIGEEEHASQESEYEYDYDDSDYIEADLTSEKQVQQKKFRKVWKIFENPLYCFFDDKC